MQPPPRVWHRPISAALLTHSYRTNVSGWESDELTSLNLGEQVPVDSEQAAAHRPYFEVLAVSPTHPGTRPQLEEFPQATGQICVGAGVCRQFRGC
jgi:hypothetical protein